jgi:hypothetical protein
MSKSYKRILTAFLILLPLLIEIFYIKSFAVNVPFWDEWELVLLLKTPPSLSTAGYLWSQHNEHRIVFPRLVLFSLARASDFNVIVPMYFNILLSALSLIGLWFIYKEVKPNSTWFFVPISWFVFNLGQWENILCGWQVVFYLSVAATIWALYLLTRSSTPSTALAVICGLIGSFSFSSGLLIWPVGLVYLINVRAKVMQTLSWGLLGTLTVIAYLWGFTLEITHLPAPTVVLSQPVKTVEFFLAHVGAPLGTDRLYWSAIVGATLLGLFGFGLWSEIKQGPPIARGTAVAAALVLFSLLSSAAVTLGRSGLGMESALVSRYKTFSIMGVIGLYIILVRRAARGNRPRSRGALVSLVLFLTLATAGVSQATKQGLVIGRMLRSERIEMQKTLLNFDREPDEALAKLYPNVSLLRERATFLRDRGLSVFGETDDRH